MEERLTMRRKNYSATNSKSAFRPAAVSLSGEILKYAKNRVPRRLSLANLFGLLLTASSSTSKSV